MAKSIQIHFGQPNRLCSVQTHLSIQTRCNQVVFRFELRNRMWKIEFLL